MRDYRTGQSGDYREEHLPSPRQVMGDTQEVVVDTTRRPRSNFWVPRWCRWDPDHPPVFTIWHNLLFAFGGAFTVANLYYNQPILNVLSEDFHVSQEVSSRIPTLMQAGYATGIIFVLPLGDLLPRRPLTLACIVITATMWYVLVQFQCSIHVLTVAQDWTLHHKVVYHIQRHFLPMRYHNSDATDHVTIGC